MTLSIDEKLLKEARQAALELDTSVNELVREYLQEVVWKQRTKDTAFIDEWRRMMEAHPISMKQRTWTRDEIHER